MGKFWKIKAKRLSRQSWDAMQGRLIAPVFQGNLTIGILSPPIAVLLFYYLFGRQRMNEELGVILVSFLAVLAAYLAYVLISLFLSPFIALKKDRELGKWSESTFVYNAPQLVCTERITVEDNNKPFVFHVPDPETNSLVSWEINAGKAKDRVRVHVDFSHGKNPLLTSPGDSTGSITLPKDKRLSFVACLLENTVPVIIRVYITSFEVQ